MPPTTSTIKLQQIDNELTVQFQLDELESLFSPTSSSRYTDNFGPGLRFGFYSFTEGGRPRQLGLYLYTAKDYPSLNITWTVAMRSLTGHSYSTKTMTYNFKCGEAIGWSRWLNLETFQENRMMKGENAVMVHATLKFAPMWPIISTSTLDVVHCALRGEEPANVRYIVYERRSRSGKLSNPRPLFTTRKALAQLCRNGNLDDINDVGLPPCIASVVLGDMELPRPHAFTSYRDDDSDFEFDPHGDESVDHEMHEIEDENSSMQTDDTAVEVKSEPRNLNAWLADLPKCSGKTVVLLGAAARTWESVLYWLYTGVIAFAPLSSAGKQKRDEFIQEYLTANPGRPIPTSCKSIYRLADDLNLGSLKRRALQHLESQLTAETNLHELFSDFTSKREDVKRIELLEVIKHWDKLKSSTALKEKLVEITSGKLPHAAGVLADLLMRTSLNDDDHPEKS